MIKAAVPETPVSLRMELSRAEKLTAAEQDLESDRTTPTEVTAGAPSLPGAVADQGREHSVIEVFVSIADSLAAGYDIVDLYSRLTVDCARLLDVDSAGLLLADAAGVLRVVAASCERSRLLECFQIQASEGPCLDCHRSGEVVLVPDLPAARARWPRFATAAMEAGFASVHAVPMRLQGTALGSLNLFGTGTGSLNAADLALAQAFAHVASVALVAGRAAADKAALAEQFQTALDSRVVLEQAKGILSQLGQVGMGDAFAALRRYARDHNMRLSDLATAVVSRGLLAGVVLAHARAKGVVTSDAADGGGPGRPGRV